MKFNFDVFLKDYTGQILTDKIVKEVEDEKTKKMKKVFESVPVKLSSVAINALSAPIDADTPNNKKKKTKAEQKVHQDLLCGKIYQKPDDDYDVEDIAMIKELIGDLYPSPTIVGASWRAIEEQEKAKVEVIDATAAKKAAIQPTTTDAKAAVN